MGLFDFLADRNNYEDRKVERFEKNNIIIDTCAVSDSNKPYETGVKHPAYNKATWVIVELYPTKSKARIGHKKWVRIMTAKKLPKTLNDVSTASITQLCDISGNDWRDHKQQTNKKVKTKIKKVKR